MKRFLWNVRAACIVMFVLRVRPRVGWDLVRSFDDQYDDGYSPREALDEELSRWDVG